MAGFPQVCYLRNAITRPNIIVGDFTYYDDPDGAERFEQYQRATDYSFRQTTQLVARLQLPPDTAQKLYAVQKEFEQRRNELYRSGTGGGAAGRTSTTVR